MQQLGPADGWQRPPGPRTVTRGASSRRFSWAGLGSSAHKNPSHNSPWPLVTTRLIMRNATTFEAPSHQFHWSGVARPQPGFVSSDQQLISAKEIKSTYKVLRAATFPAAGGYLVVLLFSTLSVAFLTAIPSTKSVVVAPVTFERAAYSIDRSTYVFVPPNITAFFRANFSVARLGRHLVDVYECDVKQGKPEPEDCPCEVDSCRPAPPYLFEVGAIRAECRGLPARETELCELRFAGEDTKDKFWSALDTVNPISWAKRVKKIPFFSPPRPVQTRCPCAVCPYRRPSTRPLRALGGVFGLAALFVALRMPWRMRLVVVSEHLPSAEHGAWWTLEGAAADAFKDANTLSFDNRGREAFVPELAYDGDLHVPWIQYCVVQGFVPVYGWIAIWVPGRLVPEAWKYALRNPSRGWLSVPAYFNAASEVHALGSLHASDPFETFKVRIARSLTSVRDSQGMRPSGAVVGPRVMAHDHALWQFGHLLRLKEAHYDAQGFTA